MQIIMPFTNIKNNSSNNGYIEIIFEPRIKRIVLIPKEIAPNSSENNIKIDFKLIYSKFRQILNKHNINIDEYKVIHIQLNKSLAKLPPHNSMKPVKTYKKMNLNLIKLKSEAYS